MRAEAFGSGGSWRDRHRSYAGRADDPDGGRAEPYERPPVPASWTPEYVGWRMVEAMSVVRRTSTRIGPKGFQTLWPEYEDEPPPLKELESWLEIARDADQTTLARARRPEPAENSRAEEAIGWCARVLADQPMQADSLSLWAWRRSAYLDEPDGARKGEDSIAKALRARRRGRPADRRPAAGAGRRSRRHGKGA
jgi:hypothetical protein